MNYSCSHPVARLNESVGRLSEEIKEQRELSARLSSSLDTQKTLLSKSILESRYEMERQCYLIDQQQKMVQVSICSLIYIGVNSITYHWVVCHDYNYNLSFGHMRSYVHQ